MAHCFYDDKKARRYARSLGIRPIGVLGIILENLKKGKLDKNEAKDLIHRLIDKGYYMTSELYARIRELIDSC